MKAPTLSDIKQLIKIETADDIQSVEIVDDFIDDGQQCAVAEINGATIEFLWHDDLKFLQEWQTFKGALFHNLQHTLMMHHIEPLLFSDEATEEMVKWADRYDQTYAQ